MSMTILRSSRVKHTAPQCQRCV